MPNTPFEHESLLLIPLMAGDHKLGMLNCRRMGLNRFTDEDLETATLFGHTAAMAWHNAQLYEELARRAMTDGLTGLYNSRWLRESGELEIGECRRRGTPLSIVLVDLDHFKTINDSGGHAAGDAVLQRVASELRRITRVGDAAVRLGGEEFVLVLRDSDAAGAARVADDLQRALRNVPIPAACSGVDSVTASIGIASFPDQGWRLDDLVRAADIAMYQAKRDGRDRVKLAVLGGTVPERAARRDRLRHRPPVRHTDGPVSEGTPRSPERPALRGRRSWRRPPGRPSPHGAASRCRSAAPPPATLAAAGRAGR